MKKEKKIIHQSRPSKNEKKGWECVARAHPLERNEDPPPIDERDKTPEYWNAPSTVLYIALYVCVWQSVSGQRLGDRENSENSAAPTRHGGRDAIHLLFSFPFFSSFLLYRL
uniref:Uncharacterized protein n=1 Tax=Trichogramma kaykai TaxID=54128 RepID=A0ABD2VX48_9HYME